MQQQLHIKGIHLAEQMLAFTVSQGKHLSPWIALTKAQKCKANLQLVSPYNVGRRRIELSRRG